MGIKDEMAGLILAPHLLGSCCCMDLSLQLDSYWPMLALAKLLTLVSPVILTSKASSMHSGCMFR